MGVVTPLTKPSPTPHVSGGASPLFLGGPWGCKKGGYPAPLVSCI